jgi:hypothetical protein
MNVVVVVIALATMMIIVLAVITLATMMIVPILVFVLPKWLILAVILLDLYFINYPARVIWLFLCLKTPNPKIDKYSFFNYKRKFDFCSNYNSNFSTKIKKPETIRILRLIT